MLSKRLFNHAADNIQGALRLEHVFGALTGKDATKNDVIGCASSGIRITAGRHNTQMRGVSSAIVTGHNAGSFTGLIWGICIPACIAIYACFPALSFWPTVSAIGTALHYALPVTAALGAAAHALAPQLGGEEGKNLRLPARMVRGALDGLLLPYMAAGALGQKIGAKLGMLLGAGLGITFASGADKHDPESYHHPVTTRVDEVPLPTEPTLRLITRFAGLAAKPAAPSENHPHFEQVRKPAPDHKPE